jgi:hypothetical protein
MVIGSLKGWEIYLINQPTFQLELDLKSIKTM